MRDSTRSDLPRHPAGALALGYQLGDPGQEGMSGRDRGHAASARSAMSVGAGGRLPCMELDSGRGAVVVRVPPDGAADALADAGRLLSTGRGVVLALDPHRRVDVRTVGELARLVLLARRGGAELVVQAPDAALRQLAELMGLRDVLGLRRAGGEPASGQAQR